MNLARLETSDDFDPVDPTAETIINGAPYVPVRAFMARREPTADIKRRLMVVAERYLAAQRDTVGG